MPTIRLRPSGYAEMVFVSAKQSEAGRIQYCPPFPSVRMSISGKDMYFVAVKVFIKKDGKLLVLKDNFGDWDIVGGRIKPDEFETSLESILGRKIKEELGSEVEITLSEMPVMFMRHERVEEAPGNPTVRIFALVYEGTLEKGEIHLSPRHTELLWADPKTFKAEEYFKDGWLKGVKEYLGKK